MKLVYFHGFMSSGASGTVESLRHMLPELEVVAPDIPVDPAEALPYLKQFVADEQPDIIVGTSMGAMYAQQMFGFKKICVNPSFNMSTMSKVMKANTTYPFQNGRKDGAKTFKITGQIVKNFNMMDRILNLPSGRFHHDDSDSQKLRYSLERSLSDIFAISFSTTFTVFLS